MIATVDIRDLERTIADSVAETLRQLELHIRDRAGVRLDAKTLGAALYRIGKHAADAVLFPNQEQSA